jgi:hypothetical protein
MQVIELSAVFQVGIGIPEREINDFSPKTHENSPLFPAKLLESHYNYGQNR